MSEHQHRPSIFSDFALRPVFSETLGLHASDFNGKAQFETTYVYHYEQQQNSLYTTRHLVSYANGSKMTRAKR